MKYYFPEEIDEFTATLFLSQIENAVAGDTVVFTIANGGEISHALKIAKEIRDKQLNTEAHYIVASASVPCYCAGVNRYSYSNASFLLHEPFVPMYVETNVNETDLKKDAETLSQYSSAIAIAIASYTGSDVDAINSFIHADGGKGVWLDVNELIDLNIITDIVIEEDKSKMAIINKLTFNGKEHDKMEQQQPETVQNEQEQALQEQSVSDPVADTLRLLSERLEAVNADLAKFIAEQSETKKRLDLIEAELKKPRALIPPLDPGIIDGVLDQKKKSALETWVSDVVKRF